MSAVNFCTALRLSHHCRSVRGTAVLILPPELCYQISVKFIAELCGWDDIMFFPLCPSAEEIESDSWAGVKLALFFLCHPLLGWSAAGAAVR